MRFTVKGIGWVTPHGLGRGRPGETLQLGPGRLPVLKSRQFLDMPHPRFGRFDSYAKAGFGAIALALRSARLDRWTHKRPIGLVVGTRLGCLEADRAYFQTAALGSPTHNSALGGPFQGGTLASPNLFAYTLPSTMLGEASIQFGLTGASFVVDDSDGHLAGICAALDLMRWGLCETAVGGWCDVNARVVNEREEGPCGAVFFVLVKGSEAAPWQWDGRELRQGTPRITDLAGLARRVLERSKKPNGDDSER
jgi:3-oxoacyl-[acyl-carrier-protein] synthase II